jgi:hypothetical protein
MRILTAFKVNPICYVSDNASNCVLANTLLADWGDATELTSSTVVDGNDDDELDDICDITELVREDAVNQLLEANEQLELDVSTRDAVSKAFRLPTDGMGCHVHSLNLLLNDALVPIEEEFQQLREFVKCHKRNSQTRDFLANFTEAGQYCYFKLDGKTRWKYAYVIL